MVAKDAVPVTAIAMKLLDVRLKPSGAIISSVIGEFTAPSSQEICVLRPGGTIELFRIEADSLKLLVRVETRSVLRSCSAVRLSGGGTRHVLAVSSDSGALAVIDFENAKAKVLHCPVFGKTGSRRDTPGQYVASDPKGRAVMICSVEKRKLVYVLNRDANGKSTIASPLEAHRNRTLTFAAIGLDNGYDNPIFATLEQQYPEEDSPETEKQLAYYELDLGLNHVSRRWATAAHKTACCLAALPGGSDGPGGVLVGGEDWIEYIHEGQTQRVICAIPRRELHPADKGILVTTLTVHRQKKSKFFGLAQSELGDVYKVSLQLDDSKTKIVGMTVALLDTLPVANSLNVSKLGMLFCASEFGNHELYQFERIDLPDAATCSSKEEAAYDTITANKVACKFHPTILKNLVKIYSMDNASPTTGVMVGELAGNEVSPQVYTLNGRGPCSSLRVLRHGASVTELAVSDLPGVPGGIFTISDGDLDRYIVVSFADATLVLSVGDTVEEVGKESLFLTNAPTLACCALLNDGGMVQVHPAGVRHIHRGQAKQWHCPGLKRIECASANPSQVIIALAGGEVTYFEIDPVNGNLVEGVTRDMGADVCCLDVGTIATGKSRSLFAAVGCRDSTVHIVSLEPDSMLRPKSSTVLRTRPHSIRLQLLGDAGTSDTILTVGLDDGSSIRYSVDPVTGTIGTSPTRRFLGARPVSVSRMTMEGRPATLLLSSRPWISRLDPNSGKHVMAPLSYAPLDHGASFSSAAIQEGIVATAGKTLRILSVDSMGGVGGSGEDEAFNTNKVDLRYTPRQMTLLSTGGTEKDKGPRKLVLAVVESDYNDYGLEEKKAMGFDFTGEGKAAKTEKQKDDDGDGMDMDDSDEEEEGKKEEKKDEMEVEDDEQKQARVTPIRGPIPPTEGHWGSCIRLLDPSDNCETLDCVEMGRNEAALCCAAVRFHSRGGEPLLAVGTVTGMTLQPPKVTASHVVLYRLVNGDRLQLLHRTTIESGPVLALAHFQGRLLVGVGKTLRFYEMGKRQLLKKCELRGLPHMVKTLQTAGDRAFVGDMLQSMQIVRYDAGSNRLALVAHDPFPRPVVSQEVLDWNTVAVGDKFGNICILRIPRGADTGGVVDLTGTRALWDSSREDSTPRLETLCQYHVGEVVTCMTRASLVAGGAESLIYVTITGRVGAFVPFTSRDDVEFYTQLEGCLRKDATRPTGRDPSSYRSYYAPVKHVVDGELCDAFNALSHEEQSKIAERVDRSIGEVMKKLEDTRNGLL